MISGEMAKKITMDVAADVNPKNSRLAYNAEMLEFYAKVKTEFEEVKKRNPHAVLDIRE